jgi:hypothetical protein
MKLIYRKKTVEVGGEVNMHCPATLNLTPINSLHEEYFPADILRLDFPKYVNQEAKRMTISMRSLLMKWAQNNQLMKQ